MGAGLPVSLLPVAKADGPGGRTSNMAAVNGGGSENLADFTVDKPTEVKENQNDADQIDIPLSPDLAAEEAKKEEIRAKIRTIEEEVVTLRQALERKEKQLTDLKKELGITAWSQLREGLSNTYTGVQQSQIYQKTSESIKNVNDKITHSNAYNKLSQGASATKDVLVDAGGKTVNAVKSAGSTASKKLGEIRESSTFQSFETKVLAATASIKEKVGGQKQSSFDEVLQSTTQAQAAEDQSAKKPSPVI